jgi:hypothetical protein
MITITEKGILIEMQGAHYDAESIFSLADELTDALKDAVAYQINETGGGGCTYWYVFELLRSLNPTLDQLRKIHPLSSYNLGQQKQ